VGSHRKLRGKPTDGMNLHTAHEVSLRRWQGHFFFFYHFLAEDKRCVTRCLAQERVKRAPPE